MDNQIENISQTEPLYLAEPNAVKIEEFMMMTSEEIDREEKYELEVDTLGCDQARHILQQNKSYIIVGEDGSGKVSAFSINQDSGPTIPKFELIAPHNQDHLFDELHSVLGRPFSDIQKHIKVGKKRHYCNKCHQKCELGIPFKVGFIEPDQDDIKETISFAGEGCPIHREEVEKHFESFRKKNS